MKKDEYQCAICKGIFKKGLTDEEAEKQLEEEFTGFNSDECELVCDDCYKKYFY